jgi:hypothetical protein
MPRWNINNLTLKAIVRIGKLQGYSKFLQHERWMRGDFLG